MNLDAAVLAEQRRKSLEERRLNPEAPAPRADRTGDATLYALGEHLRTIFDRVDINGDLGVPRCRGAFTPSTRSCPSDEVVGVYSLRPGPNRNFRAGDGEASTGPLGTTRTLNS